MRGNPFFTQERPGKDEKLFKLSKFRTMDNRKDREENLLPDEVRLNKYGRFLRKTSLDELTEAFNGNKIITESSGGMFLTNSKADAEKIRKWSTQSREVTPWCQHEELVYNYRMSNVIAGIVRGQIPYLEEHISQKKAFYMRYKEGQARAARQRFWTLWRSTMQKAVRSGSRCTNSHSSV